MSEPFRAIVTDSLRYWERLRILYNLLLLAITLWHLSPVAISSPASVDWLRSSPAVLLLAVLANILYCTAYIPDLLVQLSDYRPFWRRWRWRCYLHSAA